MNVEHAEDELIDAYARGETGLAVDRVWALEAHLEVCPTCRDRLSAAAPAVAALVAGVWSELAPRVAATAPMPRRRRWSARWSRWLTPTMAPWLAMAVSMTLLALLLDLADSRTGLGDDPRHVSLVLMLAPVLPVLGVAASWSRGIDPAYELTASAPRAGLPLLLRRTAAVLTLVVPALFACGWATGVTVAQWLLPCLAFTAMALALGGVMGVTRAVVVLAAAWVAVIVAPTLATHRMTFALQTGGLPVWGLILTLGVGVVIARKGAYSVLGAHQ
ncbi:zf-HC2 domain-containing protein [Streptomyces sp. NPDC088254]|uniref:zf-HC2 domain-containing protein n=1 Tax=Streptomyces sp. NPDC088254 TaxID=3365847 RepID=UPI0037F4CC7E